MNIYGVKTDTGSAYIVAATSERQAYDFVRRENDGFIDFDGVRRLNINVPEKHHVKEVVYDSSPSYTDDVEPIIDGLMESFLDIPAGIIDQF